MSALLDPGGEFKARRLSAIWVALALSLLVHVAVLWAWLPHLHALALDHAERDDTRAALAVQLVSEPSPTAVTPPSLASPQAPRTPPSRARQPPPRKALTQGSSEPPLAALTPAPTEPDSLAVPVIVASRSPIELPPAPPSVIAPQAPVASLPAASRPEPVPVAPVPAPVEPAPISAAPDPAPAAATPPPLRKVEGDLSAYIEARRRARGEAAAAAPTDQAVRNASSSTVASEDDRERRNRIVAANLGLQRTLTPGSPLSGGGIFELQRVSRDSAEFIFFGWDRDISRNAKQLVEVDRGDNSDIRVAVVRKMIAIIREETQSDFVWVSRRLGRRVSLSARPQDSAELEDFLLQEFFSAPRR